MNKFIILSLLILFLIWIINCSYKYLKHRRVNTIALKFMTSCMLLFTFTMVFYDDMLLHKGNYLAHESRVFLSSSLNASVKDVPDKTKKITAYFDNANPPRGSTTNLIITGPPGGKVTAICQYKGHGTPYIMDIQKNGQVVIPIKVDSNAEPGNVVVVDITVNSEGNNYKIYTVFTPR